MRYQSAVMKSVVDTARTATHFPTFASHHHSDAATGRQDLRRPGPCPIKTGAPDLSDDDLSAF